MNFWDALRYCVNDGVKISRDGWNGPGQWVVYQAGYPDGIAINENTAQATGLPAGTVRVFSPYLMIQAADASFSPWQPTQSDMLTGDWHIAD